MGPLKVPPKQEGPEALFSCFGAFLLLVCYFGGYEGCPLSTHQNSTILPILSNWRGGAPLFNLIILLPITFGVPTKGCPLLAQYCKGRRPYFAILCFRKGPPCPNNYCARKGGGATHLHNIVVGAPPLANYCACFRGKPRQLHNIVPPRIVHERWPEATICTISLVFATKGGFATILQIHSDALSYLRSKQYARKGSFAAHLHIVWTSLTERLVLIEVLIYLVFLR